MKKVSVYIFSILLIFLFIILYYYIRHESIISIISVIVVIFIVYCAGLYYVLRYPGFTLKSWQGICLIGAGLICRIVLFDTAPQVLSDDVYRYIWDGRVQHHHINPFQYPPESEHLQSLRDDVVYPLINHKQYNTIYPPVSQFFFYTANFITGERLIGYKALLFIIDMILWLCLLVLLDDRKKSLIYFISPLVIIEIYVGMHIDILGISLLIVALLCFKKQKFYVAIICLCLSILVKYISVVAVPVFFIEYYKMVHRRYQGAVHKITTDLIIKSLVFFFVLLGPFVWYYNAGVLVFKQLGTYTMFWEFNGFVYTHLKMLFSHYTGYIKIILIMGGLTYIYRHKTLNFSEKVMYSLFFTLLLSATLYPWYLLWIIPFMVLSMKKSIVFLTGVIYLSYQVLIDYKIQGVWKENYFILLIQFIPFYVLWILEARGGRVVQRQKDRGDNTCVK